MRRFLVTGLIIAALFLIPGYAQSATTGSSSLTATVPTSLSLTVTSGGTLTFGTVNPGACVVLNGTATAPTSAVTLTIVSNASWGVTIASSTANGNLLNGTILSANPVQWASSAVSASGFGPFANLTGAGALEVTGQPATRHSPPNCSDRLTD